MKKLLLSLLLVVLLAGCENEDSEPNEPRITFRTIPPKEQPRAVLYFDAEEGKFKFEGDADLATQRLFEMFQSAIDEYIREHCEPNEPDNSIRKAGRFYLATENN